MLHLSRLRNSLGKGEQQPLGGGSAYAHAMRLGCLGKSLVGWGGWSGVEVGKDDSGVRSQKALSLTLNNK